MRITDCKRTAAAGLLLAVALGSRVQAQGLGEITLDSALNEPLRAHIELLDTVNLDATQIGVALASQSEFEVAGIDSNLLLGSLRFTVVKGNNGTNDRIEITSTQNITEPYLNFLLSVTWPNGRNLREYTLLLDLPVYNDTAGGARTPNAPVANRVPDVVPAAAPAATVAATAVQSTAADDSYVVQGGDTLYRIAEQSRPSGDVSVQQMMLAIQRANEDVFVNNNINRILTGKVLRIPTAAEIALIDQAAASAQVAAQNQQLMSQPLAANDSAGNTAAPVRDELTLLSGDQNGGGSGDLDATIAALESELMLSEENLDRARLENLELTNRLAALQEQIDLLQNIIAIEDERIAQLQSELSAQSAATKQALNAADSAAQAADGSASGLVEMLKNSVVALGALLAVAAAAAGLLYTKRRRTELLEQEDSGEIAQIEPADAPPAEKAGLAAMLSTLLARFRRSDNDENDEAEPQDVHIEPILAAAEAVVPPRAPAVAEPGQSETDKVLSEIGITDELLDLDTMLDDVDNEAKFIEQPAAVSDVSGADAEATAALAEVALLDQALNEAEQQQDTDQLELEEEDFLRAPAAAASAPESFAFTTEPVSSEPEAVADAAPADDKPDVFEFTLPILDEPERGPVNEERQEKPLETFAFTTEPLTVTPEPAADDNQDALEVLSFDEDSVVLDDAPEEQGYTPAGSQDTHDARLDLAVAYEAMGDIDGAVEILDEVIASGRPTQVAEAERLKLKWQNG